MRQLLEGRPRRVGVWLEDEPLFDLDDLDGPALIEGEGRLSNIVLDGVAIESAMALRIHGALRDSLELWATLVVDGALRSGKLESAHAVAVGLRVDVFERTKMPVAVAPAAPTDGWAQAAAISAATQESAAAAAAREAAARAAAAAAAESESRPGKRKKKLRKTQVSSVPLPEKAPIPKASSRRGSFVDQPLPEVGDYVDHKQFGVCEVRSIDDEGALVIRTSQGRRRRLVLDVFDVHEGRIEDDKLIYPIRPRQRR